MTRVPEGAVVGLDLGTGGARAVVVDLEGEVLSSAEVPLEACTERRDDGLHEQDPEDWWKVVSQALASAAEALTETGRRVGIGAISIDATSGTILGVDGAGAPTTPGWMYNDARAVESAAELNALVGSSPGFKATSPLSKMRWLESRRPAEFARTERFLHQADFVVAHLGGELGVSDYSNALKTGYDLQNEAWPAWLAKHTSLSALRAKLPRVVPPGTNLGTMSPHIARKLGFPAGVALIAGVTDGTAGFLASGARRVGDDNTTLGTTLVFKRLARRPIEDREGLIYCHKLPGDRWIPGAASNTGGDWIRREFAGADLKQLDEEARKRLPTATLAYPLPARGERFPFAAADAVGFCEPTGADRLERYAACLQGTAFVERLAYEVLDRYTGPSDGDVYTTGGGSRSDVWTQLRADVSARVFHRPAHPDSAFGSAILAAAGLRSEELATAAQRMVRFERSFRPDPERTRAFDAYYARFRQALSQRGYLEQKSR